jgi:tetratricopeptide (TPR) repeat protein
MTLEVLKQGLQDKNPLVRMGAVRAVDMIKPARRLEFLGPLLNDPILAVRIETARLMAPVSPDTFTAAQRTALTKSAEEYVEAELVNGERPGAHLNLGVFYLDRGEPAKAEGAYRTAIRLDPSFYPALVNLADLYRLQGRDEEGERLLQQALVTAPDDANVHHSLGLLLIRMKRQDEAVEAFRRAAELQPDNPRHGYVYGIALNSVGQSDAAIDVLVRLHQRNPNHREVLVALATINRDQGQRDAAIRYAEKLIALSPDDEGAKEFLKQLRSNEK